MFFLQLQTGFTPNKRNHPLLYIYLLIFTLVLSGPAFALQTPATEDTTNISVSSLVTQSDTLVQEAISSNANASHFRINTTLYRESLRSLMLNPDKNGTETAPSKEVFMELVRMSALLQSAAACKTGRYIVCPIELRQQLLAQLKRLQTLSIQNSTSTS